MSNPNAIILCIQGQSAFVFMLNSEPGVANLHTGQSNEA